MTWQITLFNWTGFILLMSCMCVVIIVFWYYITTVLYTQISNWWIAKKFLQDNWTLFKKWYKERNKQ